jgi:hypothetical protein
MLACKKNNNTPPPPAPGNAFDISRAGLLKKGAVSYIDLAVDYIYPAEE